MGWLEVLLDGVVAQMDGAEDNNKGDKGVTVRVRIRRIEFPLLRNSMSDLSRVFVE